MRRVARWSVCLVTLLAPQWACADPLGAAALGGLIELVLVPVYLLVLGLVVLAYLRPASTSLYGAQLGLGSLCLWIGGIVLHISRETINGASGQLNTVDFLFLVLLMVGAWLNGVRWARSARPGWLTPAGAAVAAFALHCLVLFLVDSGGMRGYYSFSPNNGLHPATPSFLSFAMELVVGIGAWGIVRWQVGEAAWLALWHPRWRVPLLAVGVFSGYCPLLLYAQRLEGWEAQDWAIWLGQGVVVAAAAAALAQRLFSPPKAPGVAS